MQSNILQPNVFTIYSTCYEKVFKFCVETQHLNPEAIIGDIIDQALLLTFPGFLAAQQRR